MQNLLFSFCIFLIQIFSYNPTCIKKDISPANEFNYNWFYDNLSGKTAKPCPKVFGNALTGFFNLKALGEVNNNHLTIIDFSQSSSRKRMWIVNMDMLAIIHSSLVAHGRNSGEEFAASFSNTPGSYQSSLGFYLTGGTYHGSHGTSLYLDGMEPGINDNARQRTIVMHSAQYVSGDFIRNNGRLGRSFGCPAIPGEDHEKILSMLSGGSCLYIHYPCENYHARSVLLSPENVDRGMRRYLEETGHTFESLLSSLNELSVSIL
jgi:hypothetical protein